MAPSRLQRLARALRAPASQPTPAEPEDDLSDFERTVLERVRPYTMTSMARIRCVIDSVRYVVARDLPGALVECGVWRGGSVLTMILTLQELGIDDRDLFLFDTFEGMTAPTAHDVSDRDGSALDEWREAEAHGKRPWNDMFGAESFSEESVRQVVTGSGYPATRLHLVPGPVEETLPEHAPDTIALLRLDTDWYESTRHELEHLYPQLSQNGVLIVDDYGHWQGARKAVDEFFAERPVLLNRVDYTARVAIKA